MFDVVFYFRLISGLGFLFAGVLTLYGHKKNPSRYKHGAFAGILFLLAGALGLISALACVLSSS